MNRRIIVTAATGLLFWAGPAMADEAAERGRQVVDEWCRLCHQHTGDRPDRDMAPPFEELVLRPGRDEAFFVRFMEEDHFPMTVFRLFDHEKADVVAWLLSLRQPGR